jgi:catechol 2,3-dioxygenase-like lactoylglutathione lyase family enzyme
MHGLLTLFVIALYLQTQPARSAIGPPFTGARGTFFALSVADIDAGAKWYSEKLGLAVVMEQPKQNKASVVVLEGGGLTVELVQHDDAMAASKEAPLTHGILKVGLVGGRSQQDLATLKARGVPNFLGPYPARENGQEQRAHQRQRGQPDSVLWQVIVLYRDSLNGEIDRGMPSA